MRRGIWGMFIDVMFFIVESSIFYIGGVIGIFYLESFFFVLY